MLYKTTHTQSQYHMHSQLFSSVYSQSLSLQKETNIVMHERCTMQF